MSTALGEIPAWLSTYWLSVTLVRLALSLFVIYLFGRIALSVRPAELRTGIGLTAAALIVWVVAAIYLGSNNFYRIDEHTDLPPLIAYGAGLPILAGYLAFRYWRPLRQIIFAIPQHWLIGLQVYRITGGVFLLLALQGVAPRAFGMPAGVGDIVTGLLAIPVAYFCYRQKPWSRPAALAWNTLGLAELLMLIPLGILSSPSRIQFLSLDAPNHLTSTWPSVLAPTFHVPLGILLHIFSFVLLWSQADETKARTEAPSFGWQLMLASAIVIGVYAILFYVAAPLLTDRPIAFQIYPGIQQVLAAHPVGLYIHIIPAVLALLLGPFQFWEGFRARHWRRHRLMGRLYLFIGVLFGGLGALYIAQFSFAGWGARLGFSVQAILLLFTGYMAYRHIRRRETDTHREWMMRNYALVFGAVTLRLNIRLFFWLGLTLPEFHAANAWLCWIPNLLVAEWLIHRLRARRAGQGHPQPAPELRLSGD